MSKYAIVETGAKQYWVEPESVLEIEKIELSPGQEEVILDRVLFVKNGEKMYVGQPTVDGAKVTCENLGEVRGPKLISFKFRRRKASRRKIGHRQNLLKVRVKEIQV